MIDFERPVSVKDKVKVPVNPKVVEFERNHYKCSHFEWKHLDARTKTEWCSLKNKSCTLNHCPGIDENKKSNKRK